ncbi:MAG: TIGR00730 family Rossman fold protein [Candidatus Obscuribacterales bacterium]|nr:TIGR00730 family Rossman fold protein [Candidatus Obscuribacterales bacterium]
MIKRLCVFCGSSPGAKPEYVAAATAVGTYMAKKGIGLVYGGGRVGLMGAVADAALAAGGEVLGVIPQALFEKEIAHPGLTQLCVVGSMHERKAHMADLSDAFMALPGGFGTFEELFEVITWSQLGVHRKAFGLLNTLGFYNELLSFCDTAMNEKFINPVDRQLVLANAEPEKLVDILSVHQVPASTKWLKVAET